MTPARVMADADAAVTSWTAPDGRHVIVGPLEAKALEPFAEFVRRLTATSRAHRFLAAMRELSDEAALRLVLVDPRREVAWVAVECAAPHGIVGEARYALTAPGVAEVALAVADEWQRRGLGAFLLRRLLDHATAAGITFAWGHVRRDNAAALALARSFGFDVAPDPDVTSLMVVGRPLRLAPVLAASARAPRTGGTRPSAAAGGP